VETLTSAVCSKSIVQGSEPLTLNPEHLAFIKLIMLHLLKKILWDYELSDEEILSIYYGELEKGGLNEFKLKARLLNSYNWYTLIRELGFSKASQLLKPEIISHLYPKSLQKKYFYAAGLLRK
jgi:hypothetical protein